MEKQRNDGDVSTVSEDQQPPCDVIIRGSRSRTKRVRRIKRKHDQELNQ